MLEFLGGRRAQAQSRLFSRLTRAIANGGSCGQPLRRSAAPRAGAAGGVLPGRCGRARPAPPARRPGAAACASCCSRPSGLSGQHGDEAVAGALERRTGAGSRRPIPGSCPGAASRNTQPITQIRKPRAAPNRKPSVRSSAPMRESRIRSEIFTVMIETTMSVTTKIRRWPPRARPCCVDVLLRRAAGASGCRNQAAAARRHPGDDREHLAGEAAHGGQQGRDDDDAEDDEIEDGDRA